MRKMIKVFTRHKVAANIFMIFILLIGSLSLLKINRQFLPTFILPNISIDVIWPGASAEDVERAITIPIEKSLRTLQNVKKLKSSSTIGMSSIFVEYKHGTDLSNALEDAKELIGRVRKLPEDSQKPTIQEFKYYERVASMLIYGPSHIEEIRPIIHEIERDLLNRGIARIKLLGFPELTLAIKVHSQMLTRYQIDLSTLARKVAEHSRDIPAGNVGARHLRSQLRGLNQRRTIKEFRELSIFTLPSHRVIHLGDIADISFQPRESQLFVRYQDSPAVEMELSRNDKLDTITTAKIIHNWIKNEAPKLGSDLHFHIFRESWQFLNERISLLLNNGLTGLALVIIILFLFLEPRVSFWVSAGIIISLLTAVTILYFFGGSINMISLFAIIMTLGIIVDDAIVVGEEALSQYQNQPVALTAVDRSTALMALPILASSLTTICAFSPLMRVSGIVGQILFDIPFVVICVLIASLFECFFILPNHLYRSLEKKKPNSMPTWRIRFNERIDLFREKYFRKYIKIAVKHAFITIMIGFSIFICALSLLFTNHLKFTFFPSPPGKVLMANAQFISGTPDDKVQAFLAEVRSALRKTEHELNLKRGEVVKSVVSRQRISGFEEIDFKRGDEYGSVLVELVSPDARNITNEDFRNTWYNHITFPAELESFTITQPKSGPRGDDIDIILSGGDSRTLKAAALEVQTALRSYRGVINTSDDLPYGQNQLIYKLTTKGKSLGLTAESIGKQLSAAFTGALAQIYYYQDDEVEVRTMLVDSERNQISALKALPIRTPEGKLLPLSTVASLHSQDGFDVLRRTDNESTVNIKADIDQTKGNNNQILSELQKKSLPKILQKYHLRARFGGKAEEQKETLSDMLTGLFLGLILMYIILAWVFSSYTWPILVLIAVPFGLSGALFGHWIMGIDLTLISLFGFFGLSGIVINDSIILMSTYRGLCNSGYSKTDAIIESACRRLRPVILTSVTTIAGITPLLFERSTQAQFLIPMATSICFGLAFATGLILVVLPAFIAIYEYLIRNAIRIRRVIKMWLLHYFDKLSQT